MFTKLKKHEVAATVLFGLIILNLEYLLGSKSIIVEEYLLYSESITMQAFSFILAAIEIVALVFVYKNKKVASILSFVALGLSLVKLIIMFITDYYYDYFDGVIYFVWTLAVVLSPLAPALLLLKAKNEVIKNETSNLNLPIKEKEELEVVYDEKSEIVDEDLEVVYEEKSKMANEEREEINIKPSPTVNQKVSGEKDNNNLTRFLLTFFLGWIGSLVINHSSLKPKGWTSRTGIAYILLTGVTFGIYALIASISNLSFDPNKASNFGYKKD